MTKPRRKNCGYFWRIQKQLKELAEQPIFARGGNVVYIDKLKYISPTKQKYIIKHSIELNITFIKRKTKK